MKEDKFTLYVLSNDYDIFNNRDKIDRIFYKERPYISLLNEDEKSSLVFEKKIEFDAFFDPFDFQVNDDKIWIIGEYRDKLHHSRSLQFLLTFNDFGNLLYKTSLTDLTCKISNFVLINNPESSEAIINCICKEVVRQEHICEDEPRKCIKYFLKIQLSSNRN